MYFPILRESFPDNPSGHLIRSNGYLFGNIKDTAPSLEAGLEGANYWYICKPDFPPN